MTYDDPAQRKEASERVVPGETDAGTMAFHLARYEWVQPYCRDKRVLDAGCGMGYGSALLAKRASQVVAVDYAQEAIDGAAREYSKWGESLIFERHDLLEPPYPHSPFDTVVCFEVIEHLPASFDIFRALAECLSPGGTAIVSTPNDLTWSRLEASKYEYHINMRGPSQLESEAVRWFSSVELRGMRPKAAAWYSRLRSIDRLNLRLLLPQSVGSAVRAAAGIPADEQLQAGDVDVNPDQLLQSHTLIAICRDPRNVSMSK